MPRAVQIRMCSRAKYQRFGGAGGVWKYNVSKPLADYSDMEKYQRAEDEEKVPSFGVRHLQCVLVFLALTVAFIMRVNLSVAIVAMMDRNATNPDFPEYAWSEGTKSIVLSSFFWGYFVTQLPAGHLAHRFGGKVMLLCSVSVGAVLTLFTPIAAQVGNWQLVCAVRVGQGLVQGLIFPSTHTILSRWAPPEERGIMATFCYAGCPFGAILVMGVSGVLASSSFGWPGIFYASGIVSLLWVVAWLIWGAASPGEYKGITAAERQLIEASWVRTASAEEQKKALATPWLDILTSLPFIVLVIVQSSYAWGYWTMLTQIPSYMKSVLGKDIKSNALLSTLPFVANLLLSFVFCGIANMLGRRQVLSMNTSRKLFNSIGQWVPMVTIVALGYVTKEQSDLAVVLLTISVGANSASYMGFFVNHIDLSPNFAGILMGITNFAANIMSLLAPLVVGWVVTDPTNPNQWRVIFFIASGLHLVGNAFFLVLGKTNVQPWNTPKQKKHEREHIKFESISTQKEPLP